MKTEFSIDETTGEILQHDGFIRLVIAKSLYALVERLANTEAMLVNTNAQVAVNDVLLKGYARQSAEKDETIATQALALEVASERIAALEKFIRDIADSAMPEKEVNQALLFRATVRDAKTFMQGTLAPDAPVNAPKPKVERTEKIYGIASSEFLVTYPDGTTESLWSPTWHNMTPEQELSYAQKVANEKWGDKQPVITLCAIPVLQKRLVTKNNDVMALISMGNDTLVMFPRAWHLNHEVIEQAIASSAKIKVRAKTDYSTGKLQYIFDEML